ncbi:sigma factor [Sinomonas gamaensis]|uniref:RNA polymerase sigma factor n=1 Tax=Sinomonas gamaensis TaxID=2565624 RepID=UPI001BB23902
MARELEDLWSRSLRGKGASFGALYDTHRDLVFNHAYRLCGNHHNAEDMMASAFLERWRRRKDVRVVEGACPAVAATAGRSGGTGSCSPPYPGSEDLSESVAEDAPSGCRRQLDHELAPALGGTESPRHAPSEPGRLRGAHALRRGLGPEDQPGGGQEPGASLPTPAHTGSLSSSPRSWKEEDYEQG